MIGVVATVWYVGAAIVSDNFLFDSLSALSLMIAFYYALTGIACVIFWRHELLRSVKNFLFIGVAPLVGAVGLGYCSSSRRATSPIPRLRTAERRCSGWAYRWRSRWHSRSSGSC